MPGAAGLKLKVKRDGVRDRRTARLWKMKEDINVGVVLHLQTLTFGSKMRESILPKVS